MGLYKNLNGYDLQSDLNYSEDATDTQSNELIDNIKKCVFFYNVKKTSLETSFDKLKGLV